MRFSHDTLGQRVIVDAGGAVARVRAELTRLAATSTMLIGSARQSNVLDDLDGPGCLRWAEVVQHVPIALADRARAAADEADVDVVVAVGGGSAIGLAKAVALAHPVRIIAVPTTFAGSEATHVWGLTDQAGKRTGLDIRVLPASVVYDADLTLSMPTDLAAASGLNAIAHCVDAFWGPAADPINAALAGEGLRALRQGLQQMFDGTGDSDGRQQAQYGCYLAATAFSSAGSGMHHKICHVLGGTFGLPHAATHAIVLPYVLAWNVIAAPDASQRIAAAFGTQDPLAGLERLRTAVRAPRALRDIGLAESDLPRAVATALAVIPPSNPRPVDEPSLSLLLRAAWAGAPAATLLQEPAG